MRRPVRTLTSGDGRLDDEEATRSRTADTDRAERGRTADIDAATRLRRLTGASTLTVPGGRVRPAVPSVSVPRAPRARRAARPAAALEWREQKLPVLGRLWAAAWLPSILLAASLVALMYLVQTSGVATAGYDIQRLQIERASWQGRNEQLRLELAKRRSLTWIESEAVNRLGMVHADPPALTYVEVSR